jgi:ribose transport system substrate-binding protein
VSRTLRIILAVGAVVALVGCSSGASPSAGGASPAASEPAASGGAEGAVIGFSQANGGDEWRINQTNNVKDFCAEYNAGAEVLTSDAQGDDAVQSGHVDEFIGRPVDVLLLTPNTAAGLTEAAKRAMDAGIPVITMDRGVDTPVTQHIGADNKLIGQRAAEYVSKNILGGNGGKVVEIQGTQGSSATIDRHDEFVKWLEANDPKVEIVNSVDGDYSREQALQVMTDLLPTLAGGEVIYTHNDAMGLGAIAALEEAGRLADFKVVGIDGQNEAYTAIKDGKMVVTFTYDNAGKEACQSAADLLAGKTVDPQWVIETNTVDASNVDDWVGKGFGPP